ncbi:uncharacterized protein LOC134137198 [Rhea pennata]|uniref:uncharacterized protein LOC134137198 n=1 Tax=Rhea pennata TaxID=8795 RepID=UPI002E275BC8
MGDFNHPDICWRDYTARHKLSRRLLQCTDNFLSQVVEEPTRKGVLLDLALTNREGLVGDTKVGGSLGCSDHKMVEFRMLQERSKATSRIATPVFGRADFGLFRDLIGGISWVKALEGRRVQESWLVFKHHFLQAQERCIPMSKKCTKRGRRPAWVNKELLAKFRQKKKVHRMWKRGQATWENYRNAVRVCRDAARKAKAQLELSLARHVKDNRKGFFKCISSKRKTRENVGLLLKGAGALVTRDTEKAVLLNSGNSEILNPGSPHESRSLEVREKVQRREDFPLVEEDRIRDLLGRLDIHKSMGPDRMHLRVLRELADVVAKLLSIISERSRRTGEVPEDWRKAKVTPVFKNGKKEDPGN